MGAVQAAGPSFVGQTPRAFLPSGAPAPSSSLVAANNALYQYQYKNQSGGANINGSAIFKSTDGGTTWTELDSANSPNSSCGAITLDTANNRLIVALNPVTSPPTIQPIILKAFSLATDTWGANIATGGPSGLGSVKWVFLRPDTSIVVIYDFGTGNPGGTSRLRAAVWTGAWSGSIDVGVAIVAFDASGNVATGSTCAAMDSTGNIHLAFSNAANTQFEYQLFKTDNSLGTSHNFGAISVSDPGFTSLVVQGNNVFISDVENAFVNNVLYVGTPLSAPVFSTVTPANLAFPGGFINHGGPLASDGTNLYWLVNFFDPTFFTYVGFKLFKSTDSGQTWAIVPDNATEPFFYDFTPGQSPVAPNADPTFGALNPTLYSVTSGATTTLYAFANVRNTVAGIFLGYFLNSEAFGAPVGPPNLKITLRGIKRFEAVPMESPCEELPEPAHVKRAM